MLASPKVLIALLASSMALLLVALLFQLGWVHIFGTDATDTTNATNATNATDANASQTIDRPAVPAPTAEDLAIRWIVAPVEAQQLIAQGATLLDARSESLQRNGTLQGAIGVSWQQFSQPDAPERGNLLKDDATLMQKLRQVGIFNHRPVVVMADPAHGWGEDGRIVWMLRTLGHQSAVLIDGGYPALVNAGLPQTRSIAHAAAIPGDFVIHRVADWEIQRDPLKAALGRKKLVVVDVRESREFNGKTPYGEQRGGHIPGAIHLHYKALLDANGKLVPRAKILAKLQALGISPDADIVAYCTGGIRSGWFTSVLTSLGFRARNYAGSMWEWSASPVADYPLVTN
jgi:thiosulfate/3-mercaptopyruvate sulfurtransferase